ncbi:MAG: DHH family phosphoesterase [Parcubacteria group bacterium]
MFSKSDIQKNRLKYLLKKSERFFIIGHAKPDGDSVGSTLALTLALTRLGKKVTPACVDELPARFNFLPQAEKVKKLSAATSELQNADAIIVVDCGSFHLAGLESYHGNKPLPLIINIDHHHDNPRYGTINLVEDKSSSTAEIVYNVIKSLSMRVDQQIATCILNGIFVDTDSFKNPNTSIETLRITSDLLSRGANLAQITSSNLKDKSLSTLKLWGITLARIKKNKRLGIISTAVTNEDLKKCNATPDDLEGIANFLNSVPDAKTSLVLSERGGNEIKGSLRTLHDNIDVSKLAATLGGGGHKKAAGFTVPGRIVNRGGRWRIV